MNLPVMVEICGQIGWTECRGGFQRASRTQGFLREQHASIHGTETLGRLAHTSNLMVTWLSETSISDSVDAENKLASNTFRKLLPRCTCSKRLAALRKRSGNAAKALFRRSMNLRSVASPSSSSSSSPIQLSIAFRRRRLVSPAKELTGRDVRLLLSRSSSCRRVCTRGVQRHRQSRLRTSSDE
jgi:hypothetical protein